jgi:conjugative transfer signal peptidase TraF
VRLAGPLALLGGCWVAGLRLNLTASLPIGLYLASRAALVRGALVVVCLPPGIGAFARARGYVPRGGPCPASAMPVGKKVLAVPGDTVTVTPGGLLVNGVPVPNSLPLPTDRNGRALPQLAHGRYVVGVGGLWVGSPYSRLSFDSRYFGAVEASRVRATVRPLWTASPEP